MRESCDVAIVGARCAGSAAASALARAGRSVVVLDRARFPSDTLSTHVLFPTGVSELARMGALEGIRALDPSEMRWVRIDAGKVVFRERFRTYEGIDHGISVPRPEQDEVLVATARANGADVREGCTVEELTWSGGRVTGLRYRDADGDDREIRASLVIGADGRRSTVAAKVGAWNPYRCSKNGRGLVFRYMDDPLAETEAAETMWQWRDNDSYAFAFPCTPAGRLLILFMGNRDEVSAARADPDGYWEAKLAEHPGIARRTEGATNVSKSRSTAEAPAFFRASSGPGWALAGDSGHFKDPVIGQGMRDAMWMGRTLGEAVAPVLDDPAALDAALRRWEAERDRECLPAYHFANLETRAQPVAPVLFELLRHYDSVPGPTLGDVFQRVRSPEELLTFPRMAHAIASALIRGEHPRREVLRSSLAELRVGLGIGMEMRRPLFRSTRTVAGSDHPGWSWPDPPREKTEAEPEDPAKAAA